MSQLLSLISILLLSTTLLGASNSYAPLTTFTAQHLHVLVLTPTVVAGEQQTLQVQVDQSSDRQATLVLEVTYPDGKVIRTVQDVRGTETLFTWVVPPDEARGTATFSLSAAGCGCDQQGTVPPPLKLESTVDGIFTIVRSP